MNLKAYIKRIPGINKLCTIRRFNREYSYDQSIFINNYSHSKKTKQKIGYNMLLITHSLEKGMGSKNPRRFGVSKTKELMKQMCEYEEYGQADKDYAFICAINALRSYIKFYEARGWEDTDEYREVKKFLSNYSNIAEMNVGSFIVEKSVLEADSKIDYKKFLASRHSVREFSTKKLCDEDFKKAVDIARLSPSACNRQMCKTYYVKNAKKAKTVIDAAQGFGGFEKDTINVIVVTFDTNANYFVGERNQGWFNAGLFSMNLVNALHSLGIGTCFCQFGNTSKEEEDLKKNLGIPESERIAVIIASGYYCEKNTVLASPRKPVEDIFRIV